MPTKTSAQTSIVIDGGVAGWFGFGLHAIIIICARQALRFVVIEAQAALMRGEEARVELVLQRELVVGHAVALGT